MSNGNIVLSGIKAQEKANTTIRRIIKEIHDDIFKETPKWKRLNNHSFKKVLDSTVNNVGQETKFFLDFYNNSIEYRVDIYRTREGNTVLLDKRVYTIHGNVFDTAKILKGKYRDYTDIITNDEYFKSLYKE